MGARKCVVCKEWCELGELGTRGHSCIWNKSTFHEVKGGHLLEPPKGRCGLKGSFQPRACHVVDCSVPVHACNALSQRETESQAALVRQRAQPENLLSTNGQVL